MSYSRKKKIVSEKLFSLLMVLLVEDTDVTKHFYSTSLTSYLSIILIPSSTEVEIFKMSHKFSIRTFLMCQIKCLLLVSLQMQEYGIKQHPFK